MTESDEALRAPIVRFVAQAEAYCAFVEQAAALGLGERLRLARVRLLDLYRAGLDLPDVDPGDDEFEPFDAERPKDWPGFGAFELYWEASDPYQMHDPGCGELSDGVIDVYCDVAEGLHHWRAGHWREAAWTWRFHFDIHWGAHAVGALRALHHALRRDVAGTR